MVIFFSVVKAKFGVFASFLQGFLQIELTSNLILFCMLGTKTLKIHSLGVPMVHI